MHCAAVGIFKTWVKEKKKAPVQPALDHRYMVNVTTSEHYGLVTEATMLTLIVLYQVLS